MDICPHSTFLKECMAAKYAITWSTGKSHTLLSRAALFTCSRVVETFEWLFIPTVSALSYKACVNVLIFLNFLLIYFIPAARDLSRCTRSFSSCGERALL